MGGRWMRASVGALRGAVVGAVLCAACAACVAPAHAQDEGEALPAVPSAEAAASLEEASPEARDTAQVTASLVVKVAKREAVSRELIAEAERLGGWFAALDSERVSLRVPTARAEAMLAFAEARGVVVDRSFSSVDVGAQLAEVEARIASREGVLAQYLALVGEAKPSAVVTVERAMTQLIGEIESLKGQQRLLAHRAEWATVDVAFRVRDRRAPARDGGSSFAWLNTLNLQDLVGDFRYGAVRSGRRARVGEVEPTGFSAYRERRERRAVSPDEVVVRVRAVRHKPQADLSFWAEAARERMEAAGYRIQSADAIETASWEGFQLAMVAPMGTEDWTYWVAVFPRGRRLILVEAAGEVSAFEARREAIVEAVRGME